MPSTKIMIASIVSALALLDGALAGDLYVKNSLTYSVYVKAARGADSATPPGESEVFKVASGQTFTVDGYGAEPNGASITLKVSPDEDLRDQYQLAVAVDPNPIATWYQLSAMNGDPFDSEKVGMGIPARADCDWERCAPGGPCEKDVHHCANSEDDIYLFLGSYE